jgi:hypothetical protein
MFRLLLLLIFSCITVAQVPWTGRTQFLAVNMSFHSPYESLLGNSFGKVPRQLQCTNPGWGKISKVNGRVREFTIDAK